MPPSQVDLATIGREIEKEVLDSLSPEDQYVFKAEVELFDKVVGVSGVCLPTKSVKRLLNSCS